MTESLANGVILGENDMLMRGVIRSVLLRVEQQVFVAADGLEALTLARQFQARLVLLDIAMPRLNGLQTCEAIRALPGYAAVPIVMLTGYGDERIRDAARRTGASDFIVKPFRPDLLLTRLAKHLGVAAEAPSGPVRVWTTRRDADPDPRREAPLEEGRKAMRIWREAERKA